MDQPQTEGHVIAKIMEDCWEMMMAAMTGRCPAGEGEGMRGGAVLVVIRVMVEVGEDETKKDGLEGGEGEERELV